MSDQQEVPNPLDQDVTVEMIDVVMRKNPLELEETEVDRIVDRLVQHRKSWEAKSHKGSRQTGGIKRKSPAKKRKTGNVDSAKVSELEDLLGDLDV